MKALHKICLISAIGFVAGTGICLAAQNTEPKPVAAEWPAGSSREKLDYRIYQNAEIASKVASSQAVLAYLRSPGPGTLKAALKTCLAVREKISGDMLNDFLIAFCYRELGDGAGEGRTLSEYTSEQKNMYRYIFYEHRADLADSLYLLPAYICAKLRDTAKANDSFPPGSKCLSFGGPISREEYRRGDRVLYKFICPKCDAMLGLLNSEALGNRLLRVKDNAVSSLLIQVAHGLDDRRRFKTDRPDTIARLVSVLGVSEGKVVGDIGCGIGQFTFPVARLVGAKGKVYAEDIDKNAVNLIRYCVEKGGIKNIEPVLGGPADTGIPPGALDIALVFHVYRGIVKEMDDGKGSLDPFLDSFFAGISKALKRDGVLVLADNLDPVFGVSAGKVTAALKKRNFRLISDKSDPRDRRLILFFKMAEPAGK